MVAEPGHRRENQSAGNHSARWCRSLTVRSTRWSSAGNFRDASYCPPGASSGTSPKWRPGRKRRPAHMDLEGNPSLCGFLRRHTSRQGAAGAWRPRRLEERQAGRCKVYHQGPAGRAQASACRLARRNPAYRSSYPTRRNLDRWPRLYKLRRIVSRKAPLPGFARPVAR
jgi:hypothetical protein